MVLTPACRPAGQSVKDMPVVQDGPPPGGFPSVRYARRLPSTGPTGPTLFLVSGAIMAYGFYLVSPGPPELWCQGNCVEPCGCKVWRGTAYQQCGHGLIELQPDATTGPCQADVPTRPAAAAANGQHAQLPAALQSAI
jgi:GRIM-19 protein